MRERERESERERERERETDSVCLNCVCFTELVVWINPLIAMSLKTRLLEGYCKCMCVCVRERERERERERDR